MCTYLFSHINCSYKTCVAFDHFVRVTNQPPSRPTVLHCNFKDRPNADVTPSRHYNLRGCFCPITLLLKETGREMGASLACAGIRVITCSSPYIRTVRHFQPHSLMWGFLLLSCNDIRFNHAAAQTSPEASSSYPASMSRNCQVSSFHVPIS